MLEAKIDTLTEAVKELTAQLKAGGLNRAAAGAPAAATKGETKATPKHTLDEMKKKCLEVREAFDSDTAATLIREVGKSKKMGDVAPENIDALYDACVAKLATKDGDDL